MLPSYLARLYYHSLRYNDFLEACAGTALVKPYVPFVEALNMVGLVTSLHAEKKEGETTDADEKKGETTDDWEEIQ